MRDEAIPFENIKLFQQLEEHLGGGCVDGKCGFDYKEYFQFLCGTASDAETYLKELNKTRVDHIRYEDGKVCYALQEHLIGREYIANPTSTYDSQTPPQLKQMELLKKSDHNSGSSHGERIF